jgi:hypothetical protein
MVVLTLDRVGTTSALAGTNHLDIAVSQTPSPLGGFNIYRLPVQDDGTDGTPNHMCTGGPCLGDYPHLGADANGFYLTTNEFNFAAPGFRGSQIYAMSKRALAAGTASIGVTQFDPANYLPGGLPGHTVWPAVSPDVEEDGRGNGILPEFGGGIQLHASGQPFEGVDAEKDRVAGRSLVRKCLWIARSLR